MPDDRQTQPIRVLVAGGGVGALEAVLALGAPAGDRVQVTLLTSSEEYVTRPMAVQEPFARPGVQRRQISSILGDHVHYVRDDLASIDTEARVVTTQGGEALAYDAAIIACGARPSVRYSHAITVDDRELDHLMHGMIQDIEADLIHRVAFVAPEGIGWPLPLYELALMTSHRAWTMGINLEAFLVTPEDRPLQVFGSAVSNGVSDLLRASNVVLHTSSFAEIPRRREILIHPGDRRLEVDRIIALPELFGPAVDGLPAGERGFIPIDDQCQVPGAGEVYAVGDAAEFPIKHGGITAQMAVTAARSIAARAGAPVMPTPLDPVMRATLLTGEKPRYLYAHRTGGHSFDSEFSETPTMDARSKVSTHYLTPRIADLDASLTA